MVWFNLVVNHIFSNNRNNIFTRIRKRGGKTMEVDEEDFTFLLEKYEDFLTDKFGPNLRFRKLEKLKRKYERDSKKNEE